MRGRSILTILTILIGTLTVLLSAPALAVADADCEASGSRIFEGAEVVVLATWQQGTKDRKRTRGFTVLSIADVVRDPKLTLSAQMPVLLKRYVDGKPGDVCLVYGRWKTNLEWDSAEVVSDAMLRYLVQSPAKDAPSPGRLQYFIRFLEDADPVVAGDAYSRVCEAEFSDFKAIARLLPRRQLREWLSSPGVAKSHLSLYGQLLGACGTPEDAQWLRSRIDHISSPTRDESIEEIHVPTSDEDLDAADVVVDETADDELEALVSAYLLLSGDAGQDHLDRTILCNPHAPDHVVQIALLSLYSLQELRGEPLPEEFFIQRACRLLDRPDLAVWAVHVLMHFDDGSSLERLMEIYMQPEMQTPELREAIVEYVVTCAQDKSGQRADEPLDQCPEGTPNERVVAARAQLKILLRYDANLVRSHRPPQTPVDL